jgi:hypothetical protein
MSLTFIRKEPAHYALFDGCREVGWLSTRAIGLCGFASPKEARRAGETAARALAQWLEARRSTSARLSLPSRSTAWLPEGEVDDFGVPPPMCVSRQCGSPRSFAFEISLPPNTLFATAVHAVQVLYGALQAPAMSRVPTLVGTAMGREAA